MKRLHHFVLLLVAALAIGTFIFGLMVLFGYIRVPAG